MLRRNLFQVLGAGVGASLLTSKAEDVLTVRDEKFNEVQRGIYKEIERVRAMGNKAQMESFLANDSVWFGTPMIAREGVKWVSSSPLIATNKGSDFSSFRTRVIRYDLAHTSKVIFGLDVPSMARTYFRMVGLPLCTNPDAVFVTVAGYVTPRGQWGEDWTLTAKFGDRTEVWAYEKPGPEVYGTFSHFEIDEDWDRLQDLDLNS